MHFCRKLLRNQHPSLPEKSWSHGRSHCGPGSESVSSWKAHQTALFVPSGVNRLTTAGPSYIPQRSHAPRWSLDQLQISNCSWDFRLCSGQSHHHWWSGVGSSLSLRVQRKTSSRLLDLDFERLGGNKRQPLHLLECEPKKTTLDGDKVSKMNKKHNSSRFCHLLPVNGVIKAEGLHSGKERH